MISKFENTKYDDVKLIREISIPSNVHGYSLGIEFMRNWILSKFDTDYFKTVHINGKHIFDDYRRFNKTQLLKVEKPAIAITPTLNTDYNRDTLDLVLGGRDVLTRRSTYYKDAFFRDFEKNQFVGVVLKQLEMNFNFRIRVKTKAQQLDVFDFLKLSCRIGATQGHHLNMDFHVPYEIMLSIADNTGFEIVDNKVKDIIGFLQYLNSHSVIPCMYKFRTVNGNCEFFIKLRDVYTHISCIEMPSLDDGEREGQLDNNFHIDFNATLKIPVPNYYYYYTNKSLDGKYKVKNSINDNNLTGLYTVSDIEPPEVNSKGWREYLSTEWMDETKHLNSIEFKELLENERLMRVIEYTKETFVSPSVFVEVKLYNATIPVNISIDWDKFEIVVNSDVLDENTKITIYVDLNYMNEQLEIIDQIYKTRLE